MKYRLKYILVICTVLIFGASCKKSSDIVFDNNGVGSNNNPPSNVPVFVNYTIKKGEQFSDKNFFRNINLTEQKFIVKFDSSAIYTTIDPTNQADINKLYGFDDNDSAHHLFSARIGWYWLNNSLWLLGYVYNNGVLENQVISKVDIGKEINCSIKVNATNYVFTVDGSTLTMPRASKIPTTKGYQLYPYFGGDELVPHEIHVSIKEL